MPVLVVVFVTMIINVLKIFDIIVNMAPAVSQSNTLATELYYVGFSSPPANGLASAIAVLLFILVVPVIFINLRRIR